MRILLCLLLASCAAEGATEADIAGEAEELLIGSCQLKADNAAKGYLKWAANANDDEMHWYSEGYWQVGGAAFHQPVRARAYWQPSVSGTRAARLDFCAQNTCTYYATYTCQCNGSCSF